MHESIFFMDECFLDALIIHMSEALRGEKPCLNVASNPLATVTSVAYIKENPYFIFSSYA